jgi:hypothetical protein
MDQSADASARHIHRIESHIERLNQMSGQASDWITYQREQNIYVTGRLDRLERQIVTLEARLSATAVQAVLETPQAPVIEAPERAVPAEVPPGDLLPPRIEPFGEQRPAAGTVDDAPAGRPRGSATAGSGTLRAASTAGPAAAAPA